jgi:exosortase
MLKEIPENRLKIERIWKISIIAVLLAILFREELTRLFERWTSDPSESHGFLIPGFSLYFVYQARQHLVKTLGEPSYWGLFFMFASLTGYLVFFYIGWYYPRQIMMIATLGAVVLFLGGWSIIRYAWLPVVFLVFAIPLPSRLYYKITMPMRELASEVAAVVLSALPNVDCSAMGVVIHGMHGSEVVNLNVAEACSGMRLLMAFLALGVAMAYLEERPAFHRLVLLCSTIPIAIFCNMVRVVMTGMIYMYIGPEWARGDMHALLGMVMLVLAFALYGLLAWTMSNMFVEEETGGVLVANASASPPEGNERD